MKHIVAKMGTTLRIISATFLPCFMLCTFASSDQDIAKPVLSMIPKLLDQAMDDSMELLIKPRAGKSS